MNRLAKEKLLDPVSFTQDLAQFKQLVENKDAALVGVYPAGSVATVANPNGTRRDEYVALTPLKGPKGVQATPYYPNTPEIGKYVITSACKNPDAAFRLADYMLSEEISIWSRFGIPKKDWLKANPGEVGTDGRQALLKPILVWGSVQNSHWAFNNPGFSTSQQQNGQVADPKDTRNLEVMLYKVTREQY